MHIPILHKEVIEHLNPQPNENFIDATFGLGGHALAILERIKPEGKLLGIELDREVYQDFLQTTNCKLPFNLTLVNDSFTNLKEIVAGHNFGPVDGILFDLGMSSWHLEESGRGFSFQKDEPLDMRYQVQSPKSKVQSLTAQIIVNTYKKEEIEEILSGYGEEKFTTSITRGIIETRKVKPIETTFQLVEVIKKAVPSWYQRKKIHFATRTFQALRIVVNDELENIKKALPEALEVLKNGGRVVVISFHSLEDRIVKNFFKENSKKVFLKILTKKPITASITEIQENPRARSAKLRAAIKLI